MDMFVETGGREEIWDVEPGMGGKTRRIKSGVKKKKKRKKGGGENKIEILALNEKEGSLKEL